VSDVTPEILVERAGSVVTAIFHRPAAHNAMTWSMYQRLRGICDEVDSDEAVRVLLLRGAGGKAFVSGTDINQFYTSDDFREGVHAFLEKRPPRWSEASDGAGAGRRPPPERGGAVSEARNP
jgi:enoyl-CoA hydratase/carnithine racemase